MDQMVCEVKEDFMSLFKIMITHLSSMEVLKNQMGLISARLDVKLEKNFTSGTNAYLQANDQILAMHAVDKRTKKEHLTEDFGGKMHNAHSNESLTQSLIEKRRKKLKSIVERLIDEGESDKWGSVDLP